jgi:hypothetical protein
VFNGGLAGVQIQRTGFNEDIGVRSLEPFPDVFRRHFSLRRPMTI